MEIWSSGPSGYAEAGCAGAPFAAITSKQPVITDRLILGKLPPSESIGTRTSSAILDSGFGAVPRASGTDRNDRSFEFHRFARRPCEAPPPQVVRPMTFRCLSKWRGGFHCIKGLQRPGRFPLYRG